MAGDVAVLEGKLKVVLMGAMGLRRVSARDPTAQVRLALLRCDPKDPSAEPATSIECSSVVTAGVMMTCDPVFDQEFNFDVIDTQNARLDLSVWDSDVSVTEEGGFLGKILIDLSMLIDHAGSTIQQTFTVRHKKAGESGKLVLMLRYDHEKSGIQSNDDALGISMQIAVVPWEAIKPYRSQYEEMITKEIIAALDSSVDVSRIEMVGLQRWKSNDGDQMGYMAHVNIHPSEVLLSACVVLCCALAVHAHAHPLSFMASTASRIL